MDKNDYFKIDAISNSQLSDFAVAPSYYKYCKDYPRKDTKDTLIGSAFHYMCFEPGKIFKYMRVLHEHERPVPGKDYRNPENQKWKSDFIAKAEADCVELISSDEFGVAEDMYDSVMLDPEAKELIMSKQNQYEKFDSWEWNGLLFKKKTDIYNEYFQADLKSCESADPKEFQRSIFGWAYHRQGGMYSDGERILRDTEFFNPFYIIAVEKKPPYLVSVHLLTDEVLEYGCQEYRKLSLQLDECRKADKWPGYAFKYDKVNNIYLPKYLKDGES